MAFGDRLLQLAQGIIANEQQRKQLEQRQEQMEFERKQSEQSLAMQKRAIQAKEEFNDIQQQFQQLKLEEAQDTELQALKKKGLDLDNQVKQSIIDKNTQASTKTSLASTDVFKLSSKVYENVKESRVATALELIGDTDATKVSGLVIPGVLPVDAEIIKIGMDTSGRKTKEGMEQAAQDLRTRWMHLQRKVELVPQAFPAAEQQILAMQEEEKAIKTALDEVSKVENGTVTEVEYVQSATAIGVGSGEEARMLYNQVQRAGALREDIFGAIGVSKIELTVGLQAANAGDPSILTTLMKRSPTGLINERGHFTSPSEGGTLVNKWLMFEGITDPEIRKSIINSFNP